jgi:hypothetical protein
VHLVVVVIVTSGCNLHAKLEGLNSGVFLRKFFGSRDAQSLQRPFEALNDRVPALYVGPETDDCDAESMHAIFKHAVRASCVDGRVLIMSAGIRSRLPAETQLVKTIFEAAFSRTVSVEGSS